MRRREGGNGLCRLHTVSKVHTLFSGSSVGSYRRQNWRALKTEQSFRINQGLAISSLKHLFAIACPAVLYRAEPVLSKQRSAFFLLAELTRMENIKPYSNKRVRHIVDSVNIQSLSRSRQHARDALWASPNNCGNIASIWVLIFTCAVLLCHRHLACEFERKHIHVARMGWILYDVMNLRLSSACLTTSIRTCVM
jgi:hypothetical protein